LLAQQQLFSVYVHTTNGVLLPPSSIFSGCELRTRLNTTRGYAQHVLVEAEVLLLRAALGDAANAKFVTVSESSIPLYPPQVSAVGIKLCAIPSADHDQLLLPCPGISDAANASFVMLSDSSVHCTRHARELL
jgi:hypothetical protein